MVQLYDERCVLLQKKIIGGDERADRRSGVAITGGNRRVHCGLKVVTGSQRFHVGPLTLVLDLFSYWACAVQPLGTGP